MVNNLELRLQLEMERLKFMRALLENNQGALSKEDISENGSEEVIMSSDKNDKYADDDSKRDSKKVMSD